MVQTPIKQSRHMLITGASSGIGAALALHFAKADTHLSLISRNLQKLEQIAAQCRAKMAKVDLAAIDVTDKQAIKEWICKQDDAHPVDCVIANAGLSSRQAEMTYDDIAEIESHLLDVHFHGTLNTIHPLLARMKCRKSGQIAIMSSLNGFVILPQSRIYGSVKAALLHYGLALRHDLKQYNINVCTICPGWVHTPLTDLNRFYMPFIMSPEKAACHIASGLAKNKAVIAFPKFLELLSRLLANVPIFLRF